LTKVEVIDDLKALNGSQQQEWMFRLGYELTIYARECYVTGELAGDSKRLMGFNEIQHRIYGRIAALSRSEEWTEESFIEGARETA
jgi:hypothetical protein